MLNNQNIYWSFLPGNSLNNFLPGQHAEAQANLPMSVFCAGCSITAAACLHLLAQSSRWSAPGWLSQRLVGEKGSFPWKGGQDLPSVGPLHQARNVSSLLHCLLKRVGVDTWSLCQQVTTPTRNVCCALSTRGKLIKKMGHFPAQTQAWLMKSTSTLKNLIWAKNELLALLACGV